jgi:DNA polymerase-3 subunit epsilon
VQQGDKMKFVAFDLETTGTQPNENAIVEIGAVRFSGSDAVEGFGKLINPGIPIPEEASRVNGITDEMVRDAPEINNILSEFADFCGDLPVVAHNASFDFKFLLSDVKRLKGRAPTGPVLDTLSLARKVFPGMANYKLWTLVRHFDFPSGTFHRAEEDSMYCGLLFAKIVETIELRGEEASIEHLAALMGREAFLFPQFKESSDQMDLF